MLDQSRIITLYATRKGVRKIIAKAKPYRNKMIRIKKRHDDVKDINFQINSAKTIIKCSVRVLNDLKVLEEKEILFDEEKLKSMTIQLAAAYDEMVDNF